MKQGKRLTKEHIGLICEYHANSFTPSRIGQILGINPSTVHYALNKHYLYKHKDPIIMVLPSIINNDDKEEYHY